MHGVLAAVPVDAVDELEREGFAHRAPVLRGAALDALVIVGTDAAALVTLLQTPDSIRAFAAWIHGRFVQSGESVELTINHKDRRVKLTVDGDIDIEAVLNFLEEAFADRDYHT